MFRFPVALTGVMLLALPVAAFADPVPLAGITNTATLDGSAFARAIGLVRVNVAAGVGNEQINAATIGFGRAASDAVLAGVSTSQRIGPIQTVNVGAHDRVIVTP